MPSTSDYPVDDSATIGAGIPDADLARLIAATVPPSMSVGSATPPHMTNAPAQLPERAADAFDELLADWDSPPRCEMNPCRRPARWRVALHGCEHVIMCGEHCRAWVRDTAGRFATGLVPRCAHCGQIFASLDVACTVGAL